MYQQTSKLSFLVILALTANTTAEAPKQSPQSNILVHEIIIAAPVADVWNAFTRLEDITQWMVPNAEIDFRIGGKLRTNYNPEGTIGDENTIEQTYLAYEHQRMLAMKVTRCPADFPFKDEIAQTWGIIYFDALTSNSTHLRIAGIGYGTGVEWDRMRKFFEQGNEWELQQLKKFLEKPSDINVRASEIDLNENLAPLQRFIGGQWEVHGKWSSGQPLHARSVYELALSGKFIHAKTYSLHKDGTEYQRYESFFGWNSEEEVINYSSYTYDGSVSSGTMTSRNGSTLLYDWTEGSTHKSGTIGQTIEFLSNDEARWLVWIETDKGKEQLLDAIWKRKPVAQLEWKPIMESQGKKIKE